MRLRFRYRIGWFASTTIIAWCTANGQDAHPPPAVRAAPKPPAKEVAGIPVNYDEALVGTYKLPDPLVLANGKPVRDAKTWYDKRRPEIVRLFAARLREVRHSRGMTQADLARRAHVTTSYVGRLESGGAAPGIMRNPF